MAATRLDVSGSLDPLRRVICSRTFSQAAHCDVMMMDSKKDEANEKKRDRKRKAKRKERSEEVHEEGINQIYTICSQIHNMGLDPNFHANHNSMITYHILPQSL